MHSNAVVVSRTQKWFRFVMGGIVNTGFTYVIYLLMRGLMGYQCAYFLAYVIGVVFAYWFNATIVFKVPLQWKSFFSYPLIYIAQYAISALLLGMLVYRMGFNEMLAPLVVAVLMVPVAYLLNAKVLR